MLVQGRKWCDNSRSFRQRWCSPCNENGGAGHAHMEDLREERGVTPFAEELDMEMGQIQLEMSAQVKR